MKKATTKNKSYGSAAIYILWLLATTIYQRSIFSSLKNLSINCKFCLMSSSGCIYVFVSSEQFSAISWIHDKNFLNWSCLLCVGPTHGHWTMGTDGQDYTTFFFPICKNFAWYPVVVIFSLLIPQSDLYYHKMPISLSKSCLE